MESGFQAESLPSDFRAELVLSDPAASADFLRGVLEQGSFLGQYELGRMSRNWADISGASLAVRSPLVL